MELETLRTEKECKEEKHRSTSSKMASCMLDNMEQAFFRLGFMIGMHPWATLGLSVLLCLLCGSGLVFWNENTDNEIIWTPRSSPFVATSKWMQSHFPKDMRYEIIILGDDNNVLTANHIRFLRRLNETVHGLSSGRDKEKPIAYLDLCFLDLEGASDSSGQCHVESILSLFESNALMSDEYVLSAVSSALKSNESARIRRLMSGVEVDSMGHVVSAKAVMSVWVLKSHGMKMEGKAESDPLAEEWETRFTETINNRTLMRDLGLPINASISSLADKSFMDEIEGAVASNYYRLFIGCSLIFVYIALVLGRRHPVQQRVLLALTGPVMIVFAIVSSFGVCSAIGLFAANMHPVIPFLLLAIGVDDLFVIVQSLENLPARHRSASIALRMGETLRHAGVSVTVTSATDAVAFIIGSTTDMPVLRSFCLYAAAGVLCLYVFALTYFTACLTLDERRIDAGRIWRGQWRLQWQPHFDLDSLPAHACFTKCLVPTLFKPVVRASVVGITLLLLGVGIVGMAQLETNCDTKWYVRSGSDVAHFFQDLQHFFPHHGQQVHVYVGKIDYWRHLDQLEDLHSRIQNNEYIQRESVSNWFPVFYKEYCDMLQDDFNLVARDVEDQADFFDENDDNFFVDFDIDHERISTTNQSRPCEDELTFKQSFLLFLNDHRSFYPDFRFNLDIRSASRQSLWNGNFEILASRSSFRHVRLENTRVENAALNSVQSQLSTIHFEKENFVHPVALAKEYLQWESNKLVSNELVRNLSLAFVSIIAITLLLVVHLRVTLLVLMCVVFTLINVAGSAFYLGLTIEIVTSILFILSCGMALDYAVHVGVAFVALRHKKGLSRRVRAERALSEMGLAVCHGGFTTFISFASLASSDSYVFTTFFKIFALVVLFGLWHGVIFLPVALSLIGPDHSNHLEDNLEDEVRNDGLNDNENLRSNVDSKDDSL